MTLVCRQCSRVNPEDAYYCYFDGAALAGRASSAGPINLGAQPFPSPFVFPNGTNCRNFDQLAMACQQNWKEGIAALKEGHLGAFFNTIGRGDLARIAKEAAAFPDRNRGLDQLLGKLPSQTLEAPKLRVEPTEINLGQFSIGTDRALDLSLENQGMRLVYGSAICDVPWLTLAGHSSKSFELTDELTIPIQIRGRSLRARLKQQEGHIAVESNAGNFTITIKIEVPPIPFGDGVLSGAMSPRQIAEKAKANPNGAVPLFESGTVAKWFAANGLTYPVQGPTAPGTAGVQQFFEALGLAKPPKVDFAAKPIEFEGTPGKTYDIPLTVSTQDKKHVYAYATANQPWIDGKTVKPAGRSCTIQLKVTVPQKPGETLKAKITVHANGSQKFTVPLTVTVRRKKGSAAVTLEASAASFTEAALAEAALLAARESPPLANETNDELTFAPMQPLERIAPRRSRAWLHSLPAALLVVAILGIMLRDYFSANAADDIDPNEKVGLRLDWSPRNEKDISNSLTFGLRDLTDPTRKKQLTFSPLGQTNSSVLTIDGLPRVIGNIQHGRLEGPVAAYKDKSRVATWVFSDDGVSITQSLQLIPGEPVETSEGAFKRYYDTCLVRYTLTNVDKKPHAVGFRFLLDTFIGQNDRPFFAIPGRAGLVKTIEDFHGKEIPDYIQAIENSDDLKNPGTVALLNLRLGDRLEFPSRVSLTQYPREGLRDLKNEFEVAVHGEQASAPKGPNAPRRTASKQIDDSCVVLYWKTEALAPGQSREVGFAYGVSSLGGMAELTILNPGPVVQGSDFSLVALIAGAQKGAEATIALPDGLELASGSPASVAVAPSTSDDAGKTQPSPATWIVRAPLAGRYTISVTSGGVTTHRVVTVRKTNIF